MRKIVLGIFNSIEKAESFISHLHNDLNISHDDISYLYRNHKGEVTEGGGDTAVEGAKTGAVVGGSLGALAGIATVAGLIPVIGPIFAAGPLIALLGIGGGVATTAAGAVTGAVTGSIIGALVNMGASETEAKEYEDRVTAGDVLVAVEADDEIAVTSAFGSAGAASVRTYAKKS